VNMEFGAGAPKSIASGRNHGGRAPNTVAIAIDKGVYCYW